MINKGSNKGKNREVMDDLVQLARLSLIGRAQDVNLYVRRMARRYQESAPTLSKALEELLVESPTRSTPLRRESTAPVPVDLDSRLQLLRTETISELDVQPVFPPEVKSALDQLV